MRNRHGPFDALTLARIQFAFTLSFHINFPAFSIGLASYLAGLNGLHLTSDDRARAFTFHSGLGGFQQSWSPSGEADTGSRNAKA